MPVQLEATLCTDSPSDIIHNHCQSLEDKGILGLQCDSELYDPLTGITLKNQHMNRQIHCVITQRLV